LYVGNSKFRWSAVSQVLAAIAPVRTRLGRVAIVGHGWDKLPAWAEPMNMQAAYYTDPELLRRLDVELLPPVPFTDVVCTMNRGLLSPVLTRPTFNELKFVTPRYFETPAAGSIPLFVIDRSHVQEIYGQAALELALPPDNAADKIEDVLDRPEHYAGV